MLLPDPASLQSPTTATADSSQPAEPSPPSAASTGQEGSTHTDQGHRTRKVLAFATIVKRSKLTSVRPSRLKTHTFIQKGELPVHNKLLLQIKF